jgi:membrane protein DedA with SNARE-associated domain
MGALLWCADLVALGYVLGAAFRSVSSAASTRLPMAVRGNDALMMSLALIGPREALATYGYLAVFAFVGIESLGVPFPGETMLVTAAIYAGTTGNLSIAFVIAAGAAGAIVGDNIGFGIGHWGGYRLLVRYGKYLRLDQAKLKVGRYLFIRHGGKVVFFGRFVSILRTYAAFLAGTNRMPWWRFLVFNAAGGILWATLYGLSAYYLGHEIERVGKPVGITIAVAAVIVIVVALIFVRRSESQLEAEAERVFPDPLEGFPGGRPL